MKSSDAPVSNPECTQTFPQSRPAIHAGAAMNSRPAGEQAQILLVEDNFADVVLIREAFKGLNRAHSLLVVEDGEKAIDLIERIDQQESIPCPSLLLLDLNLPRRTGTEVLRRLRQSPRCGHIPVVILTSSDAPKDREYANRLAADSYFRKPSDLNEFMKIREIVERLLGQQPSEV